MEIQHLGFDNQLFLLGGSTGPGPVLYSLSTAHARADVVADVAVVVVVDVVDVTACDGDGAGQS